MDKARNEIKRVLGDIAEQIAKTPKELSDMMADVEDIFGDTETWSKPAFLTDEEARARIEKAAAVLKPAGAKVGDWLRAKTDDELGGLHQPFKSAGGAPVLVTEVVKAPRYGMDVGQLPGTPGGSLRFDMHAVLFDPDGDIVENTVDSRYFVVVE